MTDSNRVQLCHVREVTLGTTPGTPRMRKARFTGESLAFQPVFVQSEEIRDDRMNSDPIKVNETHGGAINGELSFPPDNSPFSDWLESLFCAAWQNTPERNNDGTADSVVTGVATTNTEVTHTTGDAFVAGQLVRFTGFGVAGNNGVFKCTTGGATTSRYVGSGITDEAAPAAAARMKVVGFQGDSGDITAAAAGLASTTLDFTTLGLRVGGWIKIGGTATGDKFATAACNGWARITAIAATALSLDNLPSGWTTDAGTGKTIMVWSGDQLKNGTTVLGQTLERGFLGQASPTYISETGMVAGQGEFSFPHDEKATWTLTFTGMTGAVSATPLDASPDDATTNAVMAAGINVGRIAEAGSIISSPNFVRSLTLSVQNNVRAKGAIRGDGSLGAIDIGLGSCDVTVTAETYFGSKALLDKLFAGTATNINARIAKDSAALVFGIPRITFTEGNSPAGGRSQDVMLPLTAMASKDSTTSAHILLDRLEYYQE